MIDRELLVSLALVLGVPAYLAGRWPPPVWAGRSLLDVALVPLAAGVLTGRLAAVILDDPATLARPRDFLLIQGGVEFWPGVAAGAAWAGVGGHRASVPPLAWLASLAPFALVGYSMWEATCLVRRSCYGPLSRLGLRAAGSLAPVFPVALVVAVVVVLLALLVHRQSSPGGRVLLAVGGLAFVRSLASVWLPHVSSGLTRQHRQSVVVAVTAALAAVILAARHRHAGAHE
jgi:hypothetical protein